MIKIEAQFLEGMSAMKGLIGNNKDKSVYFETRFGIHTFFMKHSIDVLVLDRSGIVKSFIEELVPYRIYFWNPIYKRIVEMPAGRVRELKIEKGVKIDLIT